MKITNIIEYFKTGYPKQFGQLYTDCEDQKNRYLKALKTFQDIYGNRDVRVFSAPGRTEIGGNHTDHNHGKVLAASVEYDVIAIVAENDDPVIHLKSEGHKQNIVDLTDLAMQQNEIGKSNALIRGICSKYKELGYNIKGFDAFTTSNVFSGSGLSSSAAFEILLCTIINYLNDISISPIEQAQISQYAENVFFGKPCGLMDQTACAVGGMITIDFKDPAEPVVKKVNFDFEKSHTRLCITAPGDNHAG